MYEANHNNSLNDIPDNILNLINELEEFEENFKLKMEYLNNKFKIILKEATTSSNFENSICILIVVSDTPSFYSIQLFNQDYKNFGDKNVRKLYEIEVEGKNNYKMIKQDIKDLLEGHKGTSLSPQFPL